MLCPTVLLKISKYIHIYHFLCVSFGIRGENTVIIPIKSLGTLKNLSCGIFFSVIHLLCIRCLLMFLFLMHTGKSILWQQVRVSTRVYFPLFLDWGLN